MQTLALLGSIDFSLEDLERNVLNEAVIPQIFMALGGSDAVLAGEAAICVKNLMTSELLGSKCTRRLYALGLLPLIIKLLSSRGASWESDNNFIEALAVQMWCIATSIPAALPQINASPLVQLISARLLDGGNRGAESISSFNALLQAFLVAVEDNEPLAKEASVHLCPRLLDAPDFSCSFDAVHFNLLLRLMCFLQIRRSVAVVVESEILAQVGNFLLATLQTALPSADRFESDPTGVKVHFEILELAAESLELLLLTTHTNLQINAQFLHLPFVLAEYFVANFQKSFAEEGNGDRVRLVRRIFSLIGAMLTVQEQLIISGAIDVVSLHGEPQQFVAKMQQIIDLTLLSPSNDFCIRDEASGWLRAWLSAWGSEDFPEIPEKFFTSLLTAFYSSASPVVLTNTCAMTALLIPYAPETIQKESCVFLNNLLCTDPFDGDHLEVLLAAVDGVTGIFDPQSREWPAKPLKQLKTDLKLVKERLQSALSTESSSLDPTLKQAISERIKLTDRLYRIL